MRHDTIGWTTTALIVMARMLAADDARADEPSRKASPGEASAAVRILVSIPDRKLAVLEHDTVRRVYPVAVGAPLSPSPVGTFTVVNRVVNPTYYGPKGIIEPGATNPVGTRWIGLNMKGYGIHGTDQPRSIGHARSHGCIRLRNLDVEELFELIRPGAVVVITAERTPESERLFGAAAR